MVNIEMEHMVRDHVDGRIYHMEIDKTYDFSWMLGESILALTTELERMYLERMLNTLILCGETIMEIQIAGLDEDGRTLYHRVD
jgi:hypothetical protein